MKTATNDRTLTELDHVRLKNLVQRQRHGGGGPAAVDAIDELLDDATLVPSTQVAPDVVTMYARVRLRDTSTGERSMLTVCYPPDAHAERGFVSVLSPVGGSLIGLRLGDVARWTTPAGEPRAAAIEAILYQPEASGDYTR